MADITIVDALMGEGKTSWAIRRLNKSQKGLVAPGAQNKWIYICTTLDEVARIKAACARLDMRDQVPIDGRKGEHLRRLIRDGANIVATHQLFKMLLRETLGCIKEHDYRLVIDETLDVITPYSITKHDHRLLWDQAMIFEGERKTLRWNHEKWPDYRGKFSEVRNLCDNGNLVSTRDGIYLWEFPPQLLDAFKQVFVCTYMFEGQMMADYFKASAVKYDLKTLMDGELVDYDAVDTTARKQELADLITVVPNDRMNSIGQQTGKGHPLSQNWYESRAGGNAKFHMKRELDSLKKNLNNFFRQISKTPANENMWTVFNRHKPRLKGKGYTKGFVALNARATNDYSHKSACAYMVNRFHNPVILGYFQDMEIETRPDLFALTEMIQWIWRSRIRDGKPIELYLPSERMRIILINWIRYSDAEIVNGQLLWDDSYRRPFVKTAAQAA